MLLEKSKKIKRNLFNIGESFNKPGVVKYISDYRKYLINK